MSEWGDQFDALTGRFDRLTGRNLDWDLDWIPRRKPEPLPEPYPADQITELFPGDGAELPDAGEWSRAERFLLDKGVKPTPEPRGRVDPASPARTARFVPEGNRAWLRAQLRRVCIKHGFLR